MHSNWPDKQEFTLNHFVRPAVGAEQLWPLMCNVTLYLHELLLDRDTLDSSFPADDGSQDDTNEPEALIRSEPGPVREQERQLSKKV